MKNKNGFTLIEVMVVLSVLALLAVLGYSFFGSVMKEAQLTSAMTQIRKDLRTFEAAYEKYQLDNGGALPPTGVVNYKDGTMASSWVSGHLKGIPTPPAGPTTPGCTNPTPADYSYVVDWWNDPGSPTTAKESYLLYQCPSQELCEAFNDKYTRLGPNAWDYVANGLDLYGSGETMFCYRNATFWAIGVFDFR